MIRRINSCLILLLLFHFLPAQDSSPPFREEIQIFQTKDSTRFPPKKAILLAGSSSFTKWVDVQQYFPGYTIINRGFGGSSLPDVIRYADKIILPYRPRQVIIYCGENDLAGSDTVTAEMVFNRFRELFQLIRTGLPGASIAYVSMKPSPSRKHLMSKMAAGNLLIKNYLNTKRNTAYIDVFNKMLKPDGTPMTDIFVEDELHMNQKGYAIWQKIIKPYLLPASTARSKKSSSTSVNGNKPGG